MTNQEILTKAIERAIEGGWKAPFPKFTVYVPNLNWIEFNNLPQCQHTSMEPFTLIFNHDFAKTLWGEGIIQLDQYYEPVVEDQFLNTTLEVPVWQYRLQQMVVAEDPMAYLGEHL